MRAIIATFLIALSSVSHGATCTDNHFLEFFVRYSNDLAFSDQRTDWPLRVTMEEFGEPKTRTAHQIKSRAEHWGVSKTISDFLRGEPSMRVYVSSYTKSKVILTFGVEDADIVFDLKFHRRNGCWRLYELRDFDR